MSRRDSVATRCTVCRLHTTLCICDLVPTLETRTRLALLVHYREARKPTNTGQLAARCIPRSSIAIVGDLDRPLDLPVVRDGELGLVLSPDDDAVSIERYANVDQPVVLVVPDGTWRQAGKMRRRVPGLADLPCVTLPETAASTYRLRAEPRSGGLATLEAIAHALRILEGERGAEIEAALLSVFHVMVERTLWLRGALRDGEVIGGIPAAAAAKDPRGTR